MDEAHIKKLLEEFRTNKRVIEELSESCNLESILDVAFKEKMYDTILELFNPITIDNEPKMYFDIFTYLSPISWRLPIFIDRFDLPKQEKENIIKSIFNLDLEKIRQMKIGNTLPRKISGWGYPTSSINDVIYYAEPACLEAMIYLFNNNIRTTMNDTECVAGDKKERGICSIWIDYNSLSEENKVIADQLIAMNLAEFITSEKEKTISIFVPCNKEDTVGSVSDKLSNIIHAFKKQPILYGFCSREEMTSRIKEDVKNNIYDNKDLPNGISAYDFCMKLIEDGLVTENPEGNIELEDGRTFSVDDLVETILEFEDFFQSYIDYNCYYYDPSEEKYWESKELYERYLSTKSGLEESKCKLSEEISTKKSNG